MVFLLLTNNFCFNTFKSSQSKFLSFRYWPRFRTDRGRSGEQVGNSLPKGGLKMNKILEKIKNFFSGKSEKKEEPKPQQEEPKAQEKPKEQK